MSNQNNQSLKVLYVAGFGRSGTTVAANILGEAEGLVSVGELYMMWETALLRPNACGCGKMVPDCPFWNEVFEHAFGAKGAIDPKEVNRTLQTHVRTRHYLRARLPTQQQREPVELRRLHKILSKLYRSIAEVSGCNVIVDSSKRPMYGHLLSQIPGIQLYTLHMVRDPRAVAHSWARHKTSPATGRPSTRMGLVKSSVLWSGLNPITENALGNENRYIRLRYEDFAAKPRSAYRSALTLIREPIVTDPFVSENRVNIGISHTMAGNTSRFARGPVDIVADNEWETNMSAGRKALVVLLTLPLLARYDYRILGSRIA